MTAILSVDEVRELVETDLGDDAMEILVNNADQEIIDKLGALVTHTEVIRGEGLRELPLSRKASAITSATENIGGTDYPLASDDYELLSDGYSLRREQGTDEPALSWRGVITVVYVPTGGAAGELAMRKKLLCDLVKLDASYSASQQQSIGDVSATSLDHKAERDKLFAGALARNRRMPMA